MWKFAAAGAVILLTLIVGFSLIDGNGDGDIHASTSFVLPAADITGFSRAIDPYAWNFPRDHGAHDTFQTEWWYYTGNVQTAEGRHFGYQFTIFRRAITPLAALTTTTTSDWRTNQVYMAHFTLSDIENQEFYHDERYSRGGAGLAGSLPDDAHPDDGYHVFIENWQVIGTNPETTAFQITAASPQGFAIDLALTSDRPPALQGDQGLSVKGAEPGNASYYYSLSHLLTDGTITLNGRTFKVSGKTWMDREFSTKALPDETRGWNWFGLQFDDGRDLMVGNFIRQDRSLGASYGGLMINPDGTTQYLDFKAGDFSIEATGTWHSPHTGADYPAGWTITIRGAALNQSEDLQFTVTPLMDDQELHSGAIIYWEGAVKLAGAVTGYGYTELTGYAGTLTGRF